MSRKKIILTTASFLTIASVSCFAQNFQGMQVFDEILSSMGDLGKYFVSFAFMIIGLGACLLLGNTVMKVIKGQGDAKDALATFILTVVAAFAILAVIKTAMSFN